MKPVPTESGGLVARHPRRTDTRAAHVSSGERAAAYTKLPLRSRLAVWRPHGLQLWQCSAVSSSRPHSHAISSTTTLARAATVRAACVLVCLAAPILAEQLCATRESEESNGRERQIA
ncbi:hypothetical protein TcCL_Unassigned03124, partial [Trypanosoma cruzi]